MHKRTSLTLPLYYRFRIEVMATGSKSPQQIIVVRFEDMVVSLIGKTTATILASLMVVTYNVLYHLHTYVYK